MEGVARLPHGNLTTSSYPALITKHPAFACFRSGSSNCETRQGPQLSELPCFGYQRKTEPLKLMQRVCVKLEQAQRLRQDP
eukprot:1147912-Pelagomonas_calceolata.AAC.2